MKRDSLGVTIHMGGEAKLHVQRYPLIRLIVPRVTEWLPLGEIGSRQGEYCASGRRFTLFLFVRIVDARRESLAGIRVKRRAKRRGPPPGVVDEPLEIVTGMRKLGA